MTNIRTLTTKELQQRLKQGDKLEFWNVQTSPFFAGDLIPGSRRMPLNSLDRDATAVAKDAEIIAYCGGPQCPQSAQAAQKLMTLGYTNVRIYKEGLEGWKAAGHRTEKMQEVTPTT